MDISALLPYKREHAFRKRAEKISLLKLLHAIIKEIQQCLISFENLDMLAFDGPVGDTLCQIRAHKIFILSNQKNSNFNYTGLFLEQYNEHLALCIQQYEYCLYLTHCFIKKLDSREHLDLFFLNNNLNLKIENDICFIFYSYFLRKFSLKNSDGNPDHINYKAVATYFNFSIVRARKVVHYYQKMLAKLSCDHILLTASKLYSKTVSNFIHAQCLIGDRGRKVLPTYIVAKIILDHIFMNNQKFLLRIYDSNKRHLVLEYCTFAKNIAIKKYISENHSYIVFEGKTRFNLQEPRLLINIFLKIGIYKVLLSCMANHPQYAGLTLRKYRNIISPSKCMGAESDIIDYTNQYLKLL